MPVGIGIHAGEAEDSAEGIVSSAVNLAARICAQAEPGELLVSDTVRALTRSYLEVSFLPRGRRRLKGISEPVALYRVVPGRTTSPAARRNLVPSALSRRWLQRAGLAAAAAIAVAAIAVVGGTLMREGAGLEDPGGSASLGSSQSPTDLSLGAPPSSPVPSDPAFPTEAEARLLARLDESIATHCQRADPADVPQLEEMAGQVFSLAHDAGLECRLGLTSEPDVAWFWSAVPGQRLEMVSNIFFQTVGRRTLPPGDCATEDVAYGRWEFGQTEGNLLCYGSRNAILMWTYDDENLLASAIRSDGEMRPLYAWWRDHARLLGN